MSFCRARSLTPAALWPSMWRTGALSSRSSRAAFHAVPAEVTNIMKTDDAMYFSFGHESWSSTQFRSRLRAVLREASYLPDPNARQYVKARALHLSRKRAFRTWERRGQPEFAERAAREFASARKDLILLQRANQGERKCLLRILFMVYGRVGRRRHELLMPLLPTVGRDAISDLIREPSSQAEQEASKANSSLTEVYDPLDGPEVDLISEDHEQPLSGDGSPSETGNASATSDKHSLPAITPELYALAKSQKASQPPALTRKNPRHLKPIIPATNARMLPMPKKRVKNIHKKWYAEFLNRILPPLPTREWEQLRDWSNGRNLPQIHVPRRSNAGMGEFRHFGKYSALESIVIQGRIDKAVYGNRDAHAITSRFMQRIWATVFSTCSYMLHDDATNQWQVLWGHQELAASTLNAVNEIIDADDIPSVFGSLPPKASSQSAVVE